MCVCVRVCLCVCVLGEGGGEEKGGEGGGWRGVYIQVHVVAYSDSDHVLFEFCLLIELICM